MKKLLLIPITLTALTPTISMVGCNNPEPVQTFDLNQMDSFKTISGLEQHVLTCGPVSMKSGSRYAVEVDLSNWKPTRQRHKYCDASFQMTIDLQQEVGEDEAIFDNAEVWVDDTKLTYSNPTTGKVERGYFTIEQEDDEGTKECLLFIGVNTLNNTSHVKIVFDIKEIEDRSYYPIFHKVQ